MGKHRDVKGVFKTESEKGVVEYKPSKSFTISNGVNNETTQAINERYRSGLIERLKAVSAKLALGFDNFKECIKFNGDLEKPDWNWNDEVLVNLDQWRLRDLVLLVEKKAENNKK